MIGLTPHQLIARWKVHDLSVTVGTLANWRASRPRKGPPFVKAINKVFYPLAGLESWERENLPPMYANDNADPGDEHTEKIA